MTQGSENSQLNLKKAAAGFTLIEVLLAMTVLAIGLMALAELQVAAIKGLGYSRHFSVATQLAEAQLDKLMKYPFPYGQASNTAYYPLDENGNQIKAQDSGGADASPFFDTLNIVASEAFGDGLATRLWMPGPVNEHGDPAKPGEEAYVVTWTVERGGDSGTPALVGKTYGSPARYQIRFVVSALWFEKGDTSGSPSYSAVNAFSYVRPTTPDLASLWSKRTDIEGARLLDPW